MSYLSTPDDPRVAARRRERVEDEKALDALDALSDSIESLEAAERLLEDRFGYRAIADRITAAIAKAEVARRLVLDAAAL